jgi:hypothetical protein
VISAETSALVAGGMRAPAAAPAKPVAVRVLRAYMVAGKCIDVGTELAIGRAFAAELVSAGKVERIDPAVLEQTAAKAAKEKPRAQQ